MRGEYQQQQVYYLIDDLTKKKTIRNKRVVSHFVPQLLPNLFILFDFFSRFDFTQFNFFDDKILVSS